MSGGTAFVTGATGFIGLNLVKELKEQGWEVTALHRRTSDLTYLLPLGATLAEGDITDKDSLRRALPDGIDVVFHVAGNVSFDRKADTQQTRDNVEGTANMVALEKKAKRFVHTSSVAAFDVHAKRITEDTPSNAKDQIANYVRTKKAAEDEVDKGIAQGLDAVFVDPAHVIGPYDTTSWGRMIKMIHARKLPGIGPGHGSFCHVREIAKAHIAAAEKGRTGERYLLGGADASYVELTRAIQAEIGGKVPKVISPGMMRLLGRVMPIFARLIGRRPDITPEIAEMASVDILVDCSKAKRELGYRPMPLEEMVKDACAWLRQEGLLGA